MSVQRNVSLLLVLTQEKEGVVQRSVLVHSS